MKAIQCFSKWYSTVMDNHAKSFYVTMENMRTIQGKYYNSYTFNEMNDDERCNEVMESCIIRERTTKEMMK